MTDEHQHREGDPDDLPSGAGQGDKGGEDDTTSGGAPEEPDE
jgi:hypothetical protein